jgi:hypothetical protein
MSLGLVMLRAMVLHQPSAKARSRRLHFDDHYHITSMHMPDNNSLLGSMSFARGDRLLRISTVVLCHQRCCLAACTTQYTATWCNCVSADL